MNLTNIKPIKHVTVFMEFPTHSQALCCEYFLYTRLFGVWWFRSKYQITVILISLYTVINARFASMLVYKAVV